MADIRIGSHGPAQMFGFQPMTGKGEERIKSVAEPLGRRWKDVSGDRCF
jgi:hypothetical protein